MRPEFKNKRKSIERVESVLGEIEAGQAVDLIVLPEMALVGYRFEDRDDIEPYVEQAPADIGALIDTLEEPEPEDGQPSTFKWALRTS